MDRPEGVPYRLHLLAYDLDKEDLYDRTRTAFLMRVAVLTELALQGKLVEVEGTVKVATPDMTGDQALDETLLQVGADRRTWKSWVRRDYKETLEAAERQLVAQGLITLHAKRCWVLSPRPRWKSPTQSWRRSSSAGPGTLCTACLPLTRWTPLMLCWPPWPRRAVCAPSSLGRIAIPTKARSKCSPCGSERSRRDLKRQCELSV
jgi:hypothetical protein